MDPAISSRMFVFPPRAKSGDAAGRPPADETPSTPTETTLPGEKHKSLSLSWLSPHRRKDSGISISTRSSKSLRISSPTAAAAARPDRSSFGSRLSRESNRLSTDSSKLAFALSNDPVAVAGSPSSLPSPAFAPRRPDRPQEGLFDDLLDAEADVLREMGGMRQEGETEEAGAAKGESYSSDRNVEDDNAPCAETPVTRRSRELLGLAFEAVGVALPDKRNRSSYASVGSDSSAAPSISSSPGKRRNHHKAFSESLVITHLVRSPSAASTASQKRRSLAPAAAGAATGKQPRPSRWTLTESMADMFKSQRSPKLKGERKLRIETTWENRVDDKPSTPTEPKPKKSKVVQKLVTEYPLLADLLGSQNPAEEEVSRPGPFRRPDGLPCASLGPNGPRQRAIPFEIVIPPPPTSVLYQHGLSPVELESPSPQQRLRAEPHETKKWTDHEVGEESEAVMSDDQGDDGQDREEHGGGDARVQNGGTGFSRASASFIPPPKNPARFSTRAPTMPQLPAIPEGFRSKADQKKFLKPEPWLKPPSSSHHRSRSLSQLGVETEERVYFRSTPFTLTNPAFRHGPITFQKSEIKGGSLLTESPVFDLAAFQSAIGGVGDLGEVFSPEEARGSSDDDDESHMADEMTAWFEEFGFETHGELIAAEKPADRNLDRTSWDSACSMGTTLSMPLIIKTDLADSAAEVQQSLTTSSVHDLTVDYSTY